MSATPSLHDQRLHQPSSRPPARVRTPDGTRRPEWSTGAPVAATAQHEYAAIPQPSTASLSGHQGRAADSIVPPAPTGRTIDGGAQQRRLASTPRSWNRSTG
ncbi:hypothetical protein [Streptomyces sp. NPDC019793]|uniref:hypothetical protein n=1 Tax=unclassified Streptomyces TaxID=2593676 RepID=UPI0034070B72